MIDVYQLRVADATGRQVLGEISLSVSEGATLGVLGTSGAGKTTLALALLGHVRPGLRRISGSIRVAGTEIFELRGPARQVLRRSRIAYLGQDPAIALTPTMRVGALVAERLGSSDRGSVGQALEAFQLPSDRSFQRRRPYQLSGGQQQRLALARALAGCPQLLVLDELSTGLDIVTQDLVLTEIERQRAERRLTVVVVSHDLSVVARLADEIAVLHRGVLVEDGRTADVLTQPRHPYTQRLIAAYCDPAARPRTSARQAGLAEGHNRDVALQVDGLRAVHRSRRGPVVLAADDVSFDMHPGECLALIGSSGAGKTTIARTVVGLHRPDAGTIRLDGFPLAADARDRAAVQRGRLQLIPQNPAGSLNPRRSIVAAVARPLRRLHGLGRTAATAEALHLLDRVQLEPSLAGRRPGQLSGGQRQRVAIARALAARPDVLICDEITSSLDVSTQAAVLDRLDGLRAEFGLAVLFITHDLGVVARIADRVLVLDQGRLCEHGTVADVFDNPSHAATRALLAASRSLSSELRRPQPDVRRDVDISFDNHRHNGPSFSA